MNNNYLNVKEVTERLKIAKPTLYAYVHHKSIPHIKVGGKLLFEEKELTQWLNAKKQPVQVKEIPV